MGKEFEGRILDIDANEIAYKLKSIGARKIADRMIRRYVYNISENEWLSLRDDSIACTLAFTKIKSNAIAGIEETEVKVSDFKTAYRILKEVGFQFDSYQENKRLSYELDGVEFDIDTWPSLPTFLEIEAKSESEVISAAKRLGFTEDDLTYENVKDIYMRRGIDIDNIKKLKFH